MDILGHFYKYQIRNFEIKKTKNCGQATAAHSAAFLLEREPRAAGAVPGKKNRQLTKNC